MRRKFRRKPDKSLQISLYSHFYPLADLKKICISYLIEWVFAWLAWPDPDADLGNHVWGMRGVREADSGQALGLKLHHTHYSTSPIVKICIYFAIYMTCCTFLPLFADINLYLHTSVNVKLTCPLTFKWRKVLEVLELQESQSQSDPDLRAFLSAISQHPLKFILHWTDGN